ncbi:MAG: dihydrodipicolinate synthase family protein [Candidatus Krumholzibacteriia bacterium]
MRFERRSYAGIWVPLVTPFDEEELDRRTLERIVEWLLGHGVHGLLALGTTGEAPHLSDDEAEQVVRCVALTVRGRVPIMVGSGRPSTRETLRVTERLVAAGANAVLVLTPFYYRAQMDSTALAAYYQEIAAGSPAPVFVYHIPQVTGLDLDPQVLSGIVAHPNVWGFKDSSSAAGPLEATLRSTRTIGFVGSGARVLEALEAGACGGILAVAHALPEVCVRLYDAWRTGDRAAAANLQGHATALANALSGWGVAGVKHALHVRTLRAGVPRRPLPRLPRDVRERIRNVVVSALRDSHTPSRGDDPTQA